MGECFADGMFDTFYQRQERSFFFGAIADSDIRTKIQSLELVDDDGFWKWSVEGENS